MIVFVLNKKSCCLCSCLGNIVIFVWFICVRSSVWLREFVIVWIGLFFIVWIAVFIVVDELKKMDVCLGIFV